jgi:hypothetical protein
MLKSDRGPSRPLSGEVLASILWNIHGFVNEIVSLRLNHASELSAALLSPPRICSGTSAGKCIDQLRELLQDIAALQSLRLSVDRKCRDMYCRMVADTVSAECCAKASPAVTDVVNSINNHVSFLFRWIETLEAAVACRKDFSVEDGEGRWRQSELRDIVELAERAVEDCEKARILLTADAEMLQSNMLLANERLLELQEDELQEHKRNLEEISELTMSSSPLNS